MRHRFNKRMVLRRKAGVGEQDDMPDNRRMSDAIRAEAIRWLRYTWVVSLSAIAGCSNPIPNHTWEFFNRAPLNDAPGPIQFSQADALAMVEFCVDLDSQDDRHPHVTLSKKHASQPRSRAIARMREDRIAAWDELDVDDVDSRRLVARSIANKDHREDFVTAYLDSTRNGFGPFASAWTLWHKRNTNVWALVFRGTVFEVSPSVDEDVIVTTAAARDGLEIKDGRLPITFGVLPRAEVHEGFAYGVFSALFDRQFGALQAVQKYVPVGGTLIIAGHSQGAALAVLAHSLLYYAMYGADTNDWFRIRDRRYSLVSYTFAQPRPGNLQLSLDFAKITIGGANSFTFNNSIDPVTMIPTTHSFVAAAFEDSPNQHFWRILRWLNGKRNSLHNWYNAVLERGLEPEMRGVKETRLAAYAIDPSGWGPVPKPESPVSQNYATLGRVVPLIGYSDADILRYYNFEADETDEFIQHHATTYRRLMEDLYGLSPTTEAYMESQPSGRLE